MTLCQAALGFGSAATGPESGRDTGEWKRSSAYDDHKSIKLQSNRARGWPDRCRGGPGESCQCAQSPSKRTGDAVGGQAALVPATTHPGKRRTVPPGAAGPGPGADATGRPQRHGYAPESGAMGGGDRREDKGRPERVRSGQTIMVRRRRGSLNWRLSRRPPKTGAAGDLRPRSGGPDPRRAHRGPGE